jgi:hypothetical protein
MINHIFYMRLNLLKYLELYKILKIKTNWIDINNKFIIKRPP